MFLLDNLELILLTIFLLFLFGLFTSPFESLAWFSGFNAMELKEKFKGKIIKSKTPSSYLVYISGIGISGQHDFTKEERNFVEVLKKRYSTINIIDEIYPYKIFNETLTSNTWLSYLWRLALKFRKTNFKYVAYLINVRNLFQVFVSADSRYGPIFNLAAANRTIQKLLSKGYKQNRKNIIYIFASSGGAQIGVGMSRYLKDFFNCKVILISVGGGFSSNKSFKQIDCFYDISGSKDNIYKFVSYAFPGRWSISQNSYWNILIKKGRVSKYVLGGVGHLGENGYFGNEFRNDHNGKTNLELVVEILDSIFLPNLKIS